MRLQRMALPFFFLAVGKQIPCCRKTNSYSREKLFLAVGFFDR